MQNHISFFEFLNKVIDASVAKMWTLYGFMKNLPDKNSTVDTFLDYSISVYHEELLRILRRLKVPSISQIGTQMVELSLIQYFPQISSTHHKYAE